MRSTTGIHGVVHSLRKAVDTTDTGTYLLNPFLFKLCSLVYEDDIKLYTLEVVQIVLGIAVPEEYFASVPELHLFAAVIVLNSTSFFATLKKLFKRLDVVFYKLRIRSSDDAYPYTFVLEAEDNSLEPYGKALTSTSRTAKRNVLVCIFKE